MPQPESRVVFKWTFEITDERQLLDLPLAAEVLTVQMQHGQPRLWTLVDPMVLTREERVFRLLPTGYVVDLPKNKRLRYISTVQQNDGALIWHFFEEVTIDATT